MKNNNQNNSSKNTSTSSKTKHNTPEAHQKALREALALLGDMKKEQTNDENVTISEETITPTSAIDYQAVVEKELKTLADSIHQLKQENLENIAKIQTMARRHGEEETQIRKYGGSRLAGDILPALDLFKTILAMPVKSEEVKNYLVGFDMIAKQLDQALANNGISQIEVKVGDDFDPHLHEATEMVETTAVPSGKIAAINSQGYKLHDRVIKHTSVKVAK